MPAIALHVAALLRELPERALPLALLHERLARSRLFTGDRAALLDALQRRPDLFAAVEPLQPFEAEAGWSDEERRVYATALARHGRTGELRIALIEAADVNAPLLLAERTRSDSMFQPAETVLLALWSDAAEDDALRTELSHALCELDCMRVRLADSVTATAQRSTHSTIPLRGPPPAP